MEFSFKAGAQEKHLVRFSFNQFWGTLKIVLDDKIIEKRGIQVVAYPTNGEHPVNSVNFTGLSEQFFEKWEFIIDDNPKVKIRIEKQRPKFFAAILPHYYCVSVDEKIVFEITGY